MMKRGLLLLLLLLPLAVAESDCVYYFYGENCVDCQGTSIHIEQLQKSFPNVNFETFEVYYDQDNLDLLDLHYERYNIADKSQGVPIAFVGDSYFAGKVAITSLLAGAISEGSTVGCPDLDAAPIGVVGKIEPKDVLKTINFLYVTGDALAHSIRPAALALLLLLVMLVITIRDKEHIVQKGAAYLIALFFALLLAAFVAGLRMTHLTFVFERALGICSLVVGIIMLMHVGGSWHLLTGKVPGMTARCRQMGTLLLTLPGFIILSLVGGVLAAGTLSGYFTIFSDLLAVGRWFALAPLLYYCLILLTPSVLVLVALAYTHANISKKVGKKQEAEQGKWRKHYYHVLHLIVSGLMILVGLLLVFV